MIEIVESLLNDIPNWLISSNGVALSGRLRLVRNVSEFPFANSSNIVQKKAVREKVFTVLADFFKRKSIKVEFLISENLAEREINTLLGLHFISPSFRKNLDGKGICLSRDGRIFILVNEIDHIKIHLYSGDLFFNNLYEEANEIDDFLIESLNIAFSEELGFLTACPTNIGTALRVSSMMHIPSIVATGEINNIAKFLSRKEIILKGLFNREESLGDIFQLSNTETLGKTEEEIIGEVYKISEQLIKREEELREKIMSSSFEEIQDKINKSVGIVSYAKFLSLYEAFEIVSLFRMAKLSGILQKISIEEINKVFLKISPELIKAQNPAIESTQEENRIRAELLREIISEE